MCAHPDHTLGFLPSHASSCPSSPVAPSIKGLFHQFRVPLHQEYPNILSAFVRSYPTLLWFLHISYFHCLEAERMAIRCCACSASFYSSCPGNSTLIIVWGAFTLLLWLQGEQVTLANQHISFIWSQWLAGGSNQVSRGNERQLEIYAGSLRKGPSLSSGITKPEKQQPGLINGHLCCDLDRAFLRMKPTQLENIFLAIPVEPLDSAMPESSSVLTFPRMSQ